MRFSKKGCCLLSLMVIFFFTTPAFAGKAPVRRNTFFSDTVKTDKGLISGSKDKSGQIVSYKGIPFAAPPTGELRWKEPQSASAWSGVLECTKFSASPMQAKPTPFLMYTPEFLIPTEPINEDCLYLNVWTGAQSRGEKRAVIVWFYGGGFSSGGTAVPIYDGEAMAKKGIIFVSANYRVGIFGFFAHPDLTKESAHHASGNYGLMDQLAALRWVKQNIAVFGGDPNNVTIAGQSAGSMAVNCLVASPLGKGLFQKAIAESGALVIPGDLIRTSSLPEAEQAGVKIGGSISELRQMSAADLVKKSQGLTSPIIDGYVLPESLDVVFRKGKQNDVSLLTGWNEDEGFLFGPPGKAEDYKKKMTEKYGSRATDLLKFYPASTEAEAATSQMNLSRDQIFGMQNYSWANLQSQNGKSKVFVYRFRRRMPAKGDPAKYGAFHTAEVPYAYNNLDMVNRPWETVDRELADLMSSYWAQFAKTGNPSHASAPSWPAYDQKNYSTMILAEKSAAQSMPGKAALDFLVEVAKAPGH